MNLPPNINRITKNIFLGNWPSSVDPETLSKYNIKYIIGLNTRFKSQTVLNMYREMGITYLHINQQDTSSANIIRIFPTTNKFLCRALNKNKNVLVHCTMGISRASTTVMAFLLWTYYTNDDSRKNDVFSSICYSRRRLVEIYKYMKDRRRQIGPNSGFMRQLQVYETDLICLVLNKFDLNKCFIK